MQVNVSGRHTHLSAELKDYTVSRIEQLDKYSDHITNVDVIIDHEKDNHKVEMVAHVGHGPTLVAKHTGEMLNAVVDATFDKLERQVRKLKDRMRQHRPHHGAAPPPVQETEEEEDGLFEGEAEFEKEL
jgi:putative sigma-54 modulation protein